LYFASVASLEKNSGFDVKIVFCFPGSLRGYS